MPLSARTDSFASVPPHGPSGTPALRHGRRTRRRRALRRRKPGEGVRRPPAAQVGSTARPPPMPDGSDRPAGPAGVVREGVQQSRGQFEIEHGRLVHDEHVQGQGIVPPCRKPGPPSPAGGARSARPGEAPARPGGRPPSGKAAAGLRSCARRPCPWARPGGRKNLRRRAGGPQGQDAGHGRVCPCPARRR